MPREISEIPWIGLHNGVYYAFWYDKDARRTHRFSLKTKDPKAAQEAFAVFLTEGRRIHQRIAVQPLASEVLKFYEDTRGPLVADRPRLRIAVTHLIKHLGSYRIGALDHDACRIYGSLRAKEGVRNATVNREIRTLVAAVNWAVAKKFMKHEALPVLEQVEDDTRKRRALTRAEMKAALTTDDQDVHDYIMVLYYTGARRRAIERLSIDQVNFDIGVIVQEKAGEKRTKKRRPPIPMSDEIKPILARRFAANPNQLFPKESLAKRLKAHLLSVGIKDAAMAHTLRHTRATFLLLDNVPIHKVARLLGDTVETIERTYSHILATDLHGIGGKI